MNTKIKKILEKGEGIADELGPGMRNLTKYVKIDSNSKPELIENDIFTIIIPLQDTPQDKILKFCKLEKTREEIQSYINIKDREYFRKSILNPLLDEGLIELTIPDKPTSKNQKYKTTKKALKELK
jgi:ATP-dependent DNA helicase RecG